ncbi:hypothetical protein OH492_13010 [Vibrio chagasii]|nr:hypothetical protein [Vibrio chagasii]
MIQPQRLLEVFQKEKIHYGSVVANNLLPVWNPVLRPFGEFSGYQKPHYHCWIQLHSAAPMMRSAISSVLASRALATRVAEMVMYSYRGAIWKSETAAHSMRH